MRHRYRVLPVLFLLLAPGTVRSQLVFDWPLRAGTQPEAVLTGAGSVFWNQGGMAASVGTHQEAWVMHVDGPDVTGVRGAALAGVVNLPMGLRGGLGYWHLGIQDIPRTTSSPNPEAGEINVSEDVAVVALAKTLGTGTGIGGGLRYQRGAAGREARSTLEGEVGIHHRSNLPLSPRFGLALKGLGGKWGIQAGGEADLLALASSRIPIRGAYGFLAAPSQDELEHRLSLRASWMDQLHLGLGLSHLGEGGGWVPLWMLGADVGRYTLSVLRESLANNFGAVHFFQASVRFL